MGKTTTQKVKTLKQRFALIENELKIAKQQLEHILPVDAVVKLASEQPKLPFDSALHEKICELTKQCYSFTKEELKDECNLIKFGQLQTLLDAATFLLQTTNVRLSV